MVQKVPKINFLKKMKENIAGKKIRTVRRDNTGVGATLEKKLGVSENNREEHDFIDTGKFIGIKFELKSKRIGTSSKISLKTKSPTRGLSNQQILKKYGYKDQSGKDRKNLKINLKPEYGGGKQNKKWKLKRNGNIIQLIHKKDGKVAEYDLVKVGLKKKLDNLIVVEAISTKIKCKCKEKGRHDDKGRHEIFTYKKIHVFRKLKMKKVQEKIDEGKLQFEFRLHKQAKKSTKKDSDPNHDRGNVFRISMIHLNDLYTKYDTFDVNKIK